MNFWGAILKLFGWKVDIDIPLPNKCVICVAPHTSNFDFLAGLAAYRSIGRRANFLMKESWFFFPLGLIFKALGGIPVPRKLGKGGLTGLLVEKFKTSSYINLAITPEGTRSATSKWHTGIVRIAYEADVPIMLACIDFRCKLVYIHSEMRATGDIEADMEKLKAYYSDKKDAAKYPDKFIL